MTNSGHQPQYEPDVNSITQNQVDALASQVRQLGETVSAQEKQYRKCRIRRWMVQSQLTYLTAARAFRRAASSWLG